MNFKYKLTHNKKKHINHDNTPINLFKKETHQTELLQIVRVKIKRFARFKISL